MSQWKPRSESVEMHLLDVGVEEEKSYHADTLRLLLPTTESCQT